jgi:hypothetical protein
MKRRGVLDGWRFVAFVGTLVGAIGLTIYPIIIAPYFNPEPWKTLSKKTRDDNNIKAENIQPGNMKEWTDPFDRPGKPGNK